MYLDHCIIFVNSSEDANGLLNSKSTIFKHRIHKSQGTESYIFFASNAFLELIWLNPDDICENDTLKLYQRVNSKSSINGKIGFAFRGDELNDDRNKIMKYTPDYSPFLDIYAYRPSVDNIDVPILIMLNFKERENNDNYLPAIRYGIKKEDGKIWAKIKSVIYNGKIIDFEKEYFSFSEIYESNAINKLEIVIADDHEEIIQIKENIIVRIIKE